MPLLALTCINDHATEQYVHTAEDKGTETRICTTCYETLAPILSMGTGLTYFEESRGRWINNLGVEPVYITSHEQHKKEMKRAGVEWTTGWQVNGTRGWA